MIKKGIRIDEPTFAPSIPSEKVKVRTNNSNNFPNFKTVKIFKTIFFLLYRDHEKPSIVSSHDYKKVQKENFPAIDF